MKLYCESIFSGELMVIHELGRMNSFLTAGFKINHLNLILSEFNKSSMGILRKYPSIHNA